MTSLSISLSHQSPAFRPRATAVKVPAAAPETQAPWEWAMPPGQAARLRAAAGPRWLQVTAGRVWLTRSGAGLAGEDHWLASGDSLLLPAGSDWVAEGGPSARAVVLEAPKAA